jgi:hypothetical protein
MVAKGNWQPRQETEVIWETWGEGMSIVQVKMYVLAEPAKRTCEVEHIWQRAFHRVLNVRYQVGQSVIRRG